MSLVLGTGSGPGAMKDAQFVVMSASAALPNERVLTGTANRIVVTDGGAGAAVTLSPGALIVQADQANTWTVGNQQIDVPTATATGLILRTTDDDQTNPLFALYDSTSVQKLEFRLGTGSTFFIGNRAGANFVAGGGNVGLGTDSLAALTTGERNFGIGPNTLESITTSDDNVVIGSQCFRMATGDRCVGIGTEVAKAATTTTSDVGIGYASLFDLSTGDFNTGVGYVTLFRNQTGSYNTAVGARAGQGVAGTSYSGVVFIGYDAGSDETNSNRLYIANSDTATPLIYGEFDGAGNIGLRTYCPDAAAVAFSIQLAAAQTANGFEVQDSTGAVLSGADERGILFSDGGTDVTNVIIGADAGNTTMTGTQNFVMGLNAGQNLSTGEKNFLLGAASGQNLSTGEQCVFIGRSTGFRSTEGEENIYIGENAGYGNSGVAATNKRNTIIGRAAAGNTTLTYSSNDCVLIGNGAGFLINGGDNNTVIGTLAGYNVGTGSGNINFGYYAAFRQVNISNYLIIDNQLRADAATELTHSILYGTMGANPEDQQLTINVDSLTIGTDADSDVVMNWVANSNSGVLTWMEDEDWFDFSDTVKTSAGRISNTTRVAGAHTAAAADEIILIDTDGGAFTVDLPAGIEGTHYRISNVGTSGNDVTVDGDAAEQVMGAATQALSDGETINIYYNATEGWW